VLNDKGVNMAAYKQKYKEGQVKEIINSTLFGKPVKEGKAKLIKFMGYDKYTHSERWTVRFLGENMSVERKISV